METELWKQSYRLPNNLFAMGPIIFKLWVMKTENWVIEIVNPNSPLVPTVSMSNVNFFVLSILFQQSLRLCAKKNK